MFRRHAIVLLLAVPLVGTLAAGCSDDEKATPQVIFTGRVEHGTGNVCHEDAKMFDVGDFGNQNASPPVPSQPVPDGAAFSQGNAGVACSVTAAGADSFNVSASVALSGATGGDFEIDGVFKTTGDQTNIHARISSRVSTNKYDQADRGCTVRYTTPFQGVAAGRVWGEVTCPTAANPDAQTSCKVVAEFRFENCAQ